MSLQIESGVPTFELGKPEKGVVPRANHSAVKNQSFYNYFKQSVPSLKTSIAKAYLVCHVRRMG